MSDTIYTDFNPETGEVCEGPPAIKNLDAVLAKGAVPFEPGVHFGLDDDLYHAVPALSNTGIKNLLVSPTDFWARSWMAPRPDDEPEEAEHFKVGKAFDKRIVEGSETFYGAYYEALSPDDYPKAIHTADDIKEALEKCGVKPKGRKKTDWAAQLADADPSVQIWDQLKGQHEARHAGKTPLGRKLIERIEIAAAMIEKHPDLSKAFTGGMPQVSIFWVCPQTGVPMKARLDYLKPRAIVDLKTFANRRGMPIDRAIAYEIAAYRYHIQCAVYHEAVEQIPALVKAGKVVGTVDRGFLDAVVKGKDRKFLFVFQQKGIAPVARGKILPKLNVFDIARIQVNDAKRKFVECVETFGPEHWIDTAGVEEIDDTSIPSFIGN